MITAEMLDAALNAFHAARGGTDALVRAALEAAEAERMCATHHDITADIVRSCAASGIEVDSLDVLMAVERALPAAAPSSAEQAGNPDFVRDWSKVIRELPMGREAPGGANAGEDVQSIPTPEEVRKDWCVVFCSGGVDLLALANDGRYRGLANIEDYADMVRSGARALRAFVGVPDPLNETWPCCSGDPSCCPENEGYGCCMPNPATVADIDAAGGDA